MKTENIIYDKASDRDENFQNEISSFKNRRRTRHLITKIPHTRYPKKTIIDLDHEITKKLQKKHKPSAFNNFFYNRKALTKTDKFFENNFEFILYIIYKAEKNQDTNLSNSFNDFKLTMKNKFIRNKFEKLDRSLSFHSAKDDSNVKMLNKNHKIKLEEDQSIFMRNDKREMTYLQMEDDKLDLSDFEYDTDNSFIQSRFNNFNKKNLKAKKYFLDYKKRFNYYFPYKDNSNEIFKHPYKRIIYLPIFVKMTREFIANNFEYFQIKNIRLRQFLKEYKLIYTSLKERKYFTFSFDENKNLEIFLDKFQQFAFYELINKISQNEQFEEKVKYKTSKVVFTRLFNNIRNNRFLFLPDIYTKLSKHMISLLSVKSKNFYLQESLNNAENWNSNTSKSKGAKGLITIISDNLHKIAIKNRLMSQIKSGIRSPGTFLPFSIPRLLWDFIIAMCVVYNLIFIPFYFLETDHKKIYISFNDLFDMVIDGITFLDIVVNFRTGYVDSANNIVMDIEEIKKNYFLTWFLWDICSTFPWEVLFFGTNSQLMNLFKLPRVLRVNRLIKLAEKLNLGVVRLILLLVIFFLYAHWIGCFCYMLLSYRNVYYSFSTHEQTACRSHNIISQHDFSTSCKYFFSLYSGMQILNTESLDIKEDLSDVTRNSIFILAYILGQLAFSMIVGLISSSVKYFDKANYRYLSKLQEINDHLEYNNISGKIRDHVNIYYDYIWKMQKEILMKTDSVYQMTEIIRHKIIARSLRNIIPKLDFIKGDDIILGKVLEKIRKKIIMPYQIIFSEGEVTEGLYILANGKVFFEVRSLDDQEKQKYSFTIPNQKNRKISNNTKTSYLTLGINDVDKSTIEIQSYKKVENNYLNNLQDPTINTNKNSENELKIKKEFKQSLTKSDNSSNKVEKIEIHRRHRNKTVKVADTKKEIIINNINNVININNSNNNNIQVNIIQNNLNFNTEFPTNPNKKIKTSLKSKFELKSEEFMIAEIEKNSKSKVYFDLISIMIKSSRHWCTSYSNDFCELAQIKYKDLFQLFDENKSLFDTLLIDAKVFEMTNEIFSNPKIFNLISLPSSRTHKRLYRKGNLTLEEIWLDGTYFKNQINHPNNYRVELYKKDQDRIFNLISDENKK